MPGVSPESRNSVTVVSCSPRLVSSSSSSSRSPVIISGAMPFGFAIPALEIVVGDGVAVARGHCPLEEDLGLAEGAGGQHRHARHPDFRGEANWDRRIIACACGVDGAHAVYVLCAARQAGVRVGYDQRAHRESGCVCPGTFNVVVDSVRCGFLSVLKVEADER